MLFCRQFIILTRNQMIGKFNSFHITYTIPLSYILGLEEEISVYFVYVEISNLTFLRPYKAKSFFPVLGCIMGKSNKLKCPGMLRIWLPS